MGAEPREIQSIAAFDHFDPDGALTRIDTRLTIVVSEAGHSLAGAAWAPFGTDNWHPIAADEWLMTWCRARYQRFTAGDIAVLLSLGDEP